MSIHGPASPARSTSVAVQSGSLVLTPDGALALEAEIDRLRNEKQREVSARLRDARSFGTPDSNDDYLAIKEDEAVMDARIARLEETLRVAVLRSEEPTNEGAASVGSTVTVRFVGSRKQAEYRIAQPYDAAGRDAVSAASPVGLAVLGRQGGETVAVEFPNGKTRKLRILAVEQEQSA